MQIKFEQTPKTHLDLSEITDNYIVYIENGFGDIHTIQRLNHEEFAIFNISGINICYNGETYPTQRQALVYMWRRHKNTYTFHAFEDKQQARQWLRENI